MSFVQNSLILVTQKPFGKNRHREEFMVRGVLSTELVPKFWVKYKKPRFDGFDNQPHGGL